MKIYDIVREDSDLEEAPVGMMKRAAQKIGGKVNKGIARSSEVSKEANEVFNEIKIKLKRGGGYDLNKLPVEKFKEFMQAKGYDQGLDQQIQKTGADSSDPESTLDKKAIEKIVLAQTREASTTAGNTSKGKFAKKSGKGVSGSEGASADLKKVVQAIKKLSDQEKQQLRKLL